MNILIVDDDELLVEKIVEGIRWDELGIEQTFTANNIRQAKKLLEEYTIHILLSDIEMPQGSGLELLEWIRERKLPIKFLLLSSYAHFPYAQKAMMYNVHDYLLKPASNRELSEALKKLAASIETENQETEQALTEQRNRYWTSRIIEGNCPDAGKNISKLYHEDDSFQIWMIFLQVGEEKKNAKDKRFFSHTIQKTLNEFFEQQDILCDGLIRYEEFQWIVLCRSTYEIFGSDELDKMRKLLEERLAFSVYIFGKRNSTVLDLLQSETERLEKMAREAVVGKSFILCLEDWQEKPEKKPEPDWEQWNKEILFSENLIALGIKISDCLEQYWMENKLTIIILKSFYKDFMQMIFRWFEHKKLSFTQIFINEEFDARYHDSMQSLSKNMDFINWVFQRLEAFQQAEGRQDKLAEKLQLYIQSHLKEDLSRRELANFVFLSEDYISRIFINATGMSITNYITERRMDKAKEYLIETDWSVSKIAMQVGYTNFSYFSKMFKNASGHTPNEFRSRYGKNQDRITK